MDLLIAEMLMASLPSKRSPFAFARLGKPGPQTLLVRALRNHIETARRLAWDPNQEEILVHHLRTGVKRLRASWRLLRRAVPDSVFRRENRRLRNAAHRLASAREREAIAKTLKRLRERSSSKQEASLIVAAQRAFRAQPRGEQAGAKEIRQEALSMLSESVHRLEEHNLGVWGWENVLEALQDSYRKARRAHRHADSGKRDDIHHEWRKRTKDLWYQLEALAREFPAAGKIGEKLDKLQDCLGDAQDLALLEEKMTGQPHAYGGRKTADAMQGPARREKKKLRKKSLRRGRKLFHPKPRRFIRELETPCRPKPGRSSTSHG